MKWDKRWAAVTAIGGAVAAIGAVVGALVALFAYVAPHGASAAATPTPTVSGFSYSPITQGSSTYTPWPGQSTAPVWPAPTSASPAFSASALAPPQGPPAGCSEAIGVVNTYNQTAGSTGQSQAAAASQASGGMMAASDDTYDTSVQAAEEALVGDFQNMSAILNGEILADYSAAVAQTHADIKTLNATCPST